MTAPEALPLIRQMAAGLGSRARVGIVHGDFKPGNAMPIGGKSAKACQPHRLPTQWFEGN